MALYRPSPRPGERSPFYHYDFIVNGVRHRGSTEERKKDRAREVETDKKRQARAGKWNAEIKLMGFSALADAYLKLHAAGTKSEAFYDFTVRILKRHFGDRPVSSISPLDCDEFMAARRRDVGASSANASVTILKHLFSKAEEWGYLAEGANPARKLKRAEVKARDRYLQVGEEKTLLDACADWLRPIVLTALHTGGRRGEVIGLEWADLDFNAGTVCFRDTKNTDTRKVPMGDELRGALRALPNRLKGGRVFLRGEEPVNKSVLREGFEAARHTAGLDWLHFHDLRHTWATHLSGQGVPIRTLQELGGWRQLSMVMRYAGNAPGSRETAREAINKMFASPQTTPKQAPQGADADHA